MYFKFWKRVVIRDDFSTDQRVVLFLAEMVGTAILMVLGCGSCVANMWNGDRAHLESSLGFGLAVMVAVECFAHISFCNINPAVTITAVLVGKIALIEAPVYLIGQLVGAFIGFAVLRGITPYQYIELSNGLTVCSPALHETVAPWQGMMAEFLGTTFLLWTVCAVWDKRNADKEDSVPIKFGLIVGVLALVIGPYTGCHINPTRTLAPAVINNSYNNIWIYMVGPFLAAFFAPITYSVFFFDDKPTDHHESI